MEVNHALEVPGVLAVLTGADIKIDGIATIPDQANMLGLVDVAMNNTAIAAPLRNNSSSIRVKYTARSA